jgi:glycosyltransferase involved in cell wall biosynthesis
MKHIPKAIGSNMNEPKGERRIKLLLLSSVFVDRGAERIMLWLEKNLTERGYDVKIACLRHLAPFALRLRNIGGPNVYVLGMRHLFDIFAVIRLYKLLRELKPDILHIHSYRAAIWGRPLGRLAGVPVIIYSVHNKWGGKLHSLLDRWTSRYGDVVIPFSIAVKKALIEGSRINPSKVSVPVYIGVDIEKFTVLSESDIQRVRKELKIKEPDSVIGFVGALSEQKGLIYLVDAVDSLRHEFPNLRCLLIGEGEQERHLKAKVNELGLHEHVLFLGQRYDIPELLSLMDIFVLPSLWEGLPQVILEAMAARCPVLATAVDGTPEIITHGVDGWLIPPHDRSALRDSLVKLLKNEELRKNLANRGYETVCERFSVKRMVSEFDNLYKRYLYAKQ